MLNIAIYSHVPGYSYNIAAHVHMALYKPRDYTCFKLNCSTLLDNMKAMHSL